MSPASVLPKHVAAVIKHQKDPLKALAIFNSVKKQDGFKHTLFTYKCMVEKLGFNGEFEAMEGLIMEMIRSFDNGLLEGVYISAMRLYGRKGKVQEAVDVFERMDFHNCEPSVLSYNAIMNILVEHGYFNQAHRLYLIMRHEGIVPDVYTFTMRIKSFCRTKRPHAALRLLNNMPSQGCELNAVAYCTVIGGFYEENCQREANELFIKMVGSGIYPDISTFNKLIHILCKKGHVLESEKLLNKMLKKGVCPNLYTYNIFIQGLCRRGELNLAISLLDNMGAEGLTPDVITYNTLICGLCKDSKVVEGKNYLHKMVNLGLKPDAFTYNTIIYGYCKMGMVQEADKILDDAIFKGFVPDEFTYCSVIDGLCKDGDVEHAAGIFTEALGKGLKPSIILYNTLIKGLSQNGLILQALQLMNDMLKKGCEPDIWTYNLVINGLCKMGCVSDANNFLNAAIAKGYVPDVFTYNTLIDGYCKQRKIGSAIEILDGMCSHDVTPDVITYNTILNGLCKAANFEDVMELFKMMKEKGCVPNVITYNILIESLCKVRKVNEALHLLDEMVNMGLTADAVSFATLINGLCCNGDIDGAYALFRRMEEHYKISHTTATYNIMINALSEKLRVSTAQMLFSEMGDKGCEPDNYSYRVMIDGFCRVGDTDSGYNFLLRNVEEGFIPSLTTFGRVVDRLCDQHRVQEAVGIIHLMVRHDIVPEVDQKVVAAPKIVARYLNEKRWISDYSCELLLDVIRDKKLQKKNTMKQAVVDV